MSPGMGMTPETITPMLKLDCGCQFASVLDTFLMEPCSPACDTFQYALAETSSQSKPVTFLEM